MNERMVMSWLLKVMAKLQLDTVAYAETKECGNTTTIKITWKEVK